MLRFIILLTAFSLPYALCGSSHYIITAPGVFSDNVEEDVLVSIFGSDVNDEPLTVPVTITLTTSDGIKVASQTADVTSGTPKVLTFIVNVADLPSDEEFPKLTLRAFSAHTSLPFDKSEVVLVATKVILTPDQDENCTIFYNPYDDQIELWPACEDNCACAAGPCPDCERPEAEFASQNDLYHEWACGQQKGIDYVFEAIAQAVDEKDGFITLTATVYRLKTGRDQFEDVADKTYGAIRFFIINSSCAGCELFKPGHKYLIMGKDGIPYQDGIYTKYKYLLDNTSYIEKWSKKSDNKSRAKLLNTFENTMIDEGCPT